MRIRKRLALSSILTAATSDLQLQRSEAAPPSVQPSDPPKQPSDQSMAIHSKHNRWVFPKNDEKEFGDETSRVEANIDIRKIVNICDGGEDFNMTNDDLHQPSSSVQESCCEETYKVVPLKKRRRSFERNPNEETMTAKMKSKTNKKCGDDKVFLVDQNPALEDNGISNSSTGGGKKSKRGTVIMEGSRCSRVNGRGWRCCQPTLVGYSLCEHHLGKGRLRTVDGVHPPPRQYSDVDSKEEEKPLTVVSKKRTKVGVVKARSMSSLLSQI